MLPRRGPAPRALTVAVLSLALAGCAGVSWTPDTPSLDRGEETSYPAIGVSQPPPAVPPLAAGERYRIIQELEVARDRNAAAAARR